MADVTTLEQEVPAKLESTEIKLASSQPKISIKVRVDKRLDDEKKTRNPQTLEQIAKFIATQADYADFLVELLNRTGKFTLEQKKAMIDRSVEATNRWAEYKGKAKVIPGQFYKNLTEEKIKKFKVVLKASSPKIKA